jgi:hypothetical protein
MHTLHWIAVKDVDDKDMALRTVRNNLEALMGDEYSSQSWYDWFVAGGGRWNVEEGEDFAEAYKDKTNMVLSYQEKPFNDKVDECIEARIKEFAHYRSKVANIDINAELDKFNGNIDYSFGLYPLSMCVEMLQGIWNFNSYFYDMENHSTNPQHMLDNIASGDVDWYLVPVDFHF